MSDSTRQRWKCLCCVHRSLPTLWLVSPLLPEKTYAVRRAQRSDCLCVRLLHGLLLSLLPSISRISLPLLLPPRRFPAPVPVVVLVRAAVHCVVLLIHGLCRGRSSRWLPRCARRAVPCCRRALPPAFVLSVVLLHGLCRGRSSRSRPRCARSAPCCRCALPLTFVVDVVLLHSLC